MKIRWIIFTLGNAVRMINTRVPMSYEDALMYALENKPGLGWSVAAVLDNPQQDWRNDNCR